MKKGFIVWGVVIATIFLFLGDLQAEIIKEDSTSITYKQVDNKVVVIPKKPKRTIICYGSFANIWNLADGEAIAIPALKTQTSIPESMRDLPKIGSPIVPNLEKIIGLEPDLVIFTIKTERHRSAANILDKMGIATICLEYKNYTHFNDILDLFCRINGTEIEKNEKANNLIKNINNLCEQTKKLPSPKCAILFASSLGFEIESRLTNGGNMLEKLNAKNIVTKDLPARDKFSYERLLIEDPDVIMIVTMGNLEVLQEKFKKDFMDKPAWNVLKAAKAKRVHFLPAEYFLYIPGDKYYEAFLYLAKLLYPELDFSDLKLITQDEDKI